MCALVCHQGVMGKELSFQSCCNVIDLHSTSERNKKKMLRATERAIEQKIIGIMLIYMNGKPTRAADILVGIRRKNQNSMGHVMHTANNRWSIREAQWMQREQKHSRGQQRILWCN